MSAPSNDRELLIDTLVEEASDVDLVCYLAHSGGRELLKDLFECIRDAKALSKEDLLYNIGMLKQKKVEAHQSPMQPVLRRLMRPDEVVPHDVSTISGIANEDEPHPGTSVH